MRTRIDGESQAHYKLITGDMNHVNIGTENATTVVFAHGWARSHHDFISVAESIAPIASSVLLDLPGFGESARPQSAWGSSDYADHCADFLHRLSLDPVIWVGHSFGGRVGLQMAVRHPGLLSGLVLVACAGIPVPNSTTRRLNRKARQWRFKLAKRKAKTPQALDQLERQFGSADYIHSAEIGLRDVFVKVISENQTADARTITTPTRLVYGNLDNDTPVAIGRQLHELITDSQLVCCPQFGHIDILNRGRHQIALAIKDLITGATA